MAVSADTSATGEALNRLVQDQAWYQRHANLVTTVVGFLATVAAWAATQPFATEQWVQALIMLIGFAATAAGVSVTPNGFTPSQLKKINHERSRIIDSVPLVPPESVDENQGTEEPDPELEQESLEEQISQFNQARG